MKNILVLGAGGPAGVNFLRSLELEKDIRLYGADINNYNREFARPYCKEVFLIDKEYDKKLIFINRIIEEFNIDFVHAQPDPEVYFISKYRDKIKAKTFLPPHYAIEACQNKYTSALMWRDKWPQTFPFLINPMRNLATVLSEIQEQLGEQFWLRAMRGAGGKGSLLVKNLDHAYHWCKFWHFHAGINLVAQKYLSGRNFAWQSVWKNGELIASQGRERLQALYGRASVSGISGSSSVARLVNIDKLNEKAIDAIKLIDPRPHGVYSVDLTGDGDDIVPTEINAGRFFTMSYLLAKASIEADTPRGNMPLTYLKLAFDEEIPPGAVTNLLPNTFYWFRHVDCGTRLLRNF